MNYLRKANEAVKRKFSKNKNVQNPSPSGEEMREISSFFFLMKLMSLIVFIEEAPSPEKDAASLPQDNENPKKCISFVF